MVVRELTMIFNLFVGEESQMPKFKCTVLFSGAALLLCIGCNSNAVPAGSDVPKVLTYAPTKVTLEGVLSKEERYGPPNFGENPATDAKVHIYVLHLVRPVDVKGDSDAANDPGDPDVDSYSNVAEIQLEQVFGNGTGGLEEFVGKNVRVDGTLHEKVTPGDYMDVDMFVESITSK
jgi:hypothetical protein